jgi:hypothetical protein
MLSGEMEGYYIINMIDPCGIIFPLDDITLKVRKRDD